MRKFSEYRDRQSVLSTNYKEWQTGPRETKTFCSAKDFVKKKKWKDKL